MQFRTFQRAVAQPGPKGVLKPKPALQNHAVCPLKATPKPEPAAKTMISTKAILNRKPMKQAYCDKKKNRRRYKEPRHPLFLEHQDAIENSRSTLLASAEESLDTIHNDLYTRVEAIKSSHESTKALTISQLKAILAPLEDEKIETNITRNGVPISEVRRVGDSVTELKQVLATKGKEIEEAWIEWRGVQAELMQLGGDVLGGEMFKKGKEKAGAAEGGGRKSGSDGRGFKRTMELWDIELMAKKKEIEEEIQEAGRIMIRKLAASEKECVAQQEREQAIFLANLCNN